MPEEVYIIIAVSLIAVIVFTVVFVIVLTRLSKYARNNCVQETEFNDIVIGMPESQLYSLFGSPKKTIIIDDTVKVVTFIKNMYKMFMLFRFTVEAQVSIKNGAVTNINISVN